MQLSEGLSGHLGRGKALSRPGPLGLGGKEEAEEGVDEDALDGGEIYLVFNDVEKCLHEVVLQCGVAPVLLVEVVYHKQDGRGVL